MKYYSGTINVLSWLRIHNSMEMFMYWRVFFFYIVLLLSRGGSILVSSFSSCNLNWFTISSFGIISVYKSMIDWGEELITYTHQHIRQSSLTKIKIYDNTQAPQRFCHFGCKCKRYNIAPSKGNSPCIHSQSNSATRTDCLKFPTVNWKLTHILQLQVTNRSFYSQIPFSKQNWLIYVELSNYLLTKIEL